ncbi:MAG: zinc-ribbon domain-containing protein [Nitrosopumilales archaeon]|nr:MAG: zinc-ribbon domain-containing protein [Nitrosopumilales archaeon]
MHYLKQLQKNLASVCSKCGTSNPLNSSFCSKCGFSLQ